MTRRELLAAASSVPGLFAKNHIDRTHISAITDEIGTTSAESIAFAKQYGLQWVELRATPGGKKEYTFLPEPEIKAAATELVNSGLRVSFLNTSLMKFQWPDLGTEMPRTKPETEEARAKRLKSGAERFANRMDELNKAIRCSHIFGCDRLRVFTGTRVAEPEKSFDRIAETLNAMSAIAERERVHLLIENEGSCNVATSAELAGLLKLIPSKWVGLNWDPQNSLAHKEIPYPDGYALLPKKRIGNVQIKAKGVLEGPQRLDWKAILQALQKDGYNGKIGLETHVFDGTLITAAHASMEEILRLVRQL